MFDRNPKKKTEFKYYNEHYLFNYMFSIIRLYVERISELVCYNL